MLGANAVLLIGMKTVTLLCGVILTTLTFRAYRRTRAPAMRALCLGIGFVTLGAILGGSLHQFVGMPVAQSVTVEELFTAAGFFILTYSVYTDQPTTTN
jgi:O-antigen/teichoic acid export membrane protein